MKKLYLFTLLLTLMSTATIEYPIRLAYINTIPSWWPPSSIAAGMGVPGYADETLYNYIVLTFWGCSNTMDIVKIW